MRGMDRVDAPIRAMARTPSQVCATLTMRWFLGNPSTAGTLCSDSLRTRIR